LVILEMGSCGMFINLDAPNLSLPTSKDYRYELLVPGDHCLLCMREEGWVGCDCVQVPSHNTPIPSSHKMVCKWSVPIFPSGKKS
jgi:hypothetical protein